MTLIDDNSCVIFIWGCFCPQECGKTQIKYRWKVAIQLIVIDDDQWFDSHSPLEWVYIIVVINDFSNSKLTIIKEIDQVDLVGRSVNEGYHVHSIALSNARIPFCFGLRLKTSFASFSTLVDDIEMIESPFFCVACHSSLLSSRIFISGFPFVIFSLICDLSLEFCEWYVRL